MVWTWQSARKKHGVNYEQDTHTIRFTQYINADTAVWFNAALKRALNVDSSHITLNFSSVTNAYPDGMLPIITSVNMARTDGTNIFVALPKEEQANRLFKSVNWAHFLSPSRFDLSESKHDRHLVTRHFTNFDEQQEIVTDFMDMILRNMRVPRDILKGLEWSMNELTDNVLNHSDSQIGGFVQATTFQKNDHISFAVSDGGKGILSSLKEGIPTLRTDLQAIGEAIKEGVTRNKEKGQGNGLAGSLRVSTMTGGSFEVISGTGRFLAKDNKTNNKALSVNSYFQGTTVSGNLVLLDSFSVMEAVLFDGYTSSSPLDIIDRMYESEDTDEFMLLMRDETTGFGTRKSGIQIRTKIYNLLDSDQTRPLVIDWSGIPVISSSFADEVMGKLFLDLGAMTFSARIKNKGMEELVVRLIDKAVAQRLTQEKD